MIRLLDKNTIDKIAAGEVIERPSSVVKELLENSIDSGAFAITVEIKEGGMSFIRVTDNGCGINKDQVRTAYMRHATSKITDANDLNSIASLGFRGEALSTIAAVSQTEMVTKTANDLTGIKYVIHGGEEIEYKEVGVPDGTTIVVRNLFYNTPARKKFLKSPMTEGSYICDLVTKLAMSHPEISFKLIVNGKIKIDTSGNGNIKDNIYQLFGRDITSNLLSIDYSFEDIKVKGFIGKPFISRGNRGFENYFINNRYIKSNIINRAIEEGYKTFVMQHRFPFTVIYIELPFDKCDVNVHPTKMEFKYDNERQLFEVVTKAIRYALENKELIPNADESNEADNIIKKEKPAEPFEINRRNQEFNKSNTNLSGKIKSYSKPQVSDIANDINSNEPIFNILKDDGVVYDSSNKKNVDAAKSDATKSDIGKSDEIKTDTTKTDIGISQKLDNLIKNVNNRLNADNKNIINNKPYSGNNSNIDNVTNSSNSSNIDNKPYSSNNSNTDSKTYSDIKNNSNQTFKSYNNKGQSEILDYKDNEQMTFFDNKFLSEKSRIKHRLIGQVFKTYWLIEYDGCLYIMDQHAAHEKVKYEELMKSLNSLENYSQQLMPPMVITVTYAEKQAILDNYDLFMKIGYDIVEFGGNEFKINAVPANLFGIHGREMFMEFVGSLINNAGYMSNDIFVRKLSTMACKAAVKGNMQLSFAEADALIDQLLQLDNPYTCPHGRPTIISMSEKELEKKFKRIV